MIFQMAKAEKFSEWEILIMKDHSKKVKKMEKVFTTGIYDSIILEISRKI